MPLPERSTSLRIWTGSVLALALAWCVVPQGARAQVWSSRLAQEPACQTLTPSAAGGPMPRDPNVMVLRYLGVSNYEMAYRDVVILLDAGIERLAWWLPTGVSRDDMTKRVNGIFIGHAHGEHMWDAPFIAQKTGALVVADPIGMKWVRSTGLLSEKQMATVRGLGAQGETFTFNGFTVKAVLGRHNVVPGEYMAKNRAAAEAITRQGPLSEVEQKRNQELGALVRLAEDEAQKLGSEGTITYSFAFDNGFKLWYGDSAGPPTAAEQQFAKEIPGGIDVGLIPYYGGELGVPITMEYVRLFKPKIFLPTHHDGQRARMLDMPLGPIALAIREEFPRTRAISPLYRTPVCVDTMTKEVYVGQ